MQTRSQPLFKLLRLVSHAPAQVNPCFIPFIHHQRRSASILSSLSDNAKAYHKRIRRGRGPSSGKGKTSGRGHKGQKQHGKVPAGFNGGQTPLEITHTERGSKNLFSSDFVPLNLDRLQSWIQQGRIDPNRPITIRELIQSRCTSGVKDGVKLLAGGSEQISLPLHIIVSRASTAAIAAIEAAGGSVTTRFYTATAIRRIMQGTTDPVKSMLWAQGSRQKREQLQQRRYQKSIKSIAPVEKELKVPKTQTENPFLYRLPDPTSRKDMEYYRDRAHRGYLSYQVSKRQSPSLFYTSLTVQRPGGEEKLQDRHESEQQAPQQKTSAATNLMW